MRRSVTGSACLALVASACLAEDGGVAASIVEVSPQVVQVGGPPAVVRWTASCSGPVYFSVTVGAGGQVLEAGRLARCGVHETALNASSLDPCTNPLTLSLAVPGGAHDQDSTLVALCPATGCRACGPVVDGDADSDVDIDVDADADADTDVDADADADPTCLGELFPNGGECDPMTGRCCGPGERCAVVYATSGCRETCVQTTGDARQGGYCRGDGDCAQGLGCFGNGCATYCWIERGGAECTEGRTCYYWALATGPPYCETYGLCLY